MVTTVGILFKSTLIFIPGINFNIRKKDIYKLIKDSDKKERGFLSTTATTTMGLTITSAHLSSDSVHRLRGNESVYPWSQQYNI